MVERLRGITLRLAFACTTVEAAEGVGLAEPKQEEYDKAEEKNAAYNILAGVMNLIALSLPTAPKAIRPLVPWGVSAGLLAEAEATVV